MGSLALQGGIREIGVLGWDSTQHFCGSPM